MPNYVMPEDLSKGLNSTQEANTSPTNALSKGNEAMTKVNELLVNANKFMDNLSIILNRKVAQSENPQLTEAEINSKANKLMEQRQQFDDIPMEVKPVQQKRYKIIVKRDEAVENLKLMLNSPYINKKATIQHYLDNELKELEEAGMVHSAIEQWILKHTEIVEDK